MLATTEPSYCSSLSLYVSGFPLLSCFLFPVTWYCVPELWLGRVGLGEEDGAGEEDNTDEQEEHEQSELSHAGADRLSEDL